MPEQFTHDVFLSHSSRDKPVVRELAARLKRDGVRVWLDEEQIKPGDSIPAKVEEGLEHSHVPVLCLSANAFGSDLAQLACPAEASERRGKAGTCGRWREKVLGQR